MAVCVEEFCDREDSSRLSRNNAFDITIEGMIFVWKRTAYNQT